MAAHSSMMDITILKPPDKRGVFYAKEAPSIRMSTEAKQFADLSEEINNYFNNDQTTSLQRLHYEKGLYCIGRRPSDRRWFRVKIENVMQTRHGPQANCDLIDIAENALIPILWLREAPSKFCKMPAQAREHVFHGIVPVTLVTNPQTFDAQMQRTDVWDAAATNYIEKLLKVHSAKVEVIEEVKGRLHVRMYLNDGLCVNEELVREKYATYAAQSGGLMSHDPLHHEERHQISLPSKLINNTKERQAQKMAQQLKDLEHVFTSGEPLSVCTDSGQGASQEVSPSVGTYISATSPLQTHQPETRQTASQPRPARSKARMAMLKNIVGKQSSDVLTSESGAKLSPRLTETSSISKSSTSAFTTSTAVTGCGASASVDVRPKIFNTRLDRGEPAYSVLDPAIKTVHASSVLYSQPKQAESSLLIELGSDSRDGFGIQFKTGNSPSQDNSPRKSMGRGMRLLAAATGVAASSLNKPGPSKGPLSPRLEPQESIKSANYLASDTEGVRLRFRKGHSLQFNSPQPPVGNTNLLGHSVVDSQFDRRVPAINDSPANVQIKSRQAPIDKTLGHSVADPQFDRRVPAINDSPANVQIKSRQAPIDKTLGHSVADPQFDRRVPAINDSPVNVQSSQELRLNSSSASKLDNTSVDDTHDHSFLGIQTLGGKLSGRLPKHLVQQQKLDNRTSPAECRTNEYIQAQIMPSLDSSVRTLLSTTRLITMHAETVQQQYVPPVVVESTPCANPPKSILKKGSSVYFSESEADSGQQPRLPKERRPKVKYSSSDSDDTGNQSHNLGNRLLEQLGSKARSSRPIYNNQFTATNFPGIRPHHDGVLIHGEGVPRPIGSIENTTHFPDDVKQLLQADGFPGPQLIQGYSWPCIFRGSDLVGISPPMTGKTLAYLLPLLTQVMQPANYADMPPGIGPYVLILSPCWKKAQSIYDSFRRYGLNTPEVRTKVIYGGGAEESQAVQLINGCEILVATPHCLLRVLKKQYTSLQRLCHIVLDDADILTEQFHLQIREIMSIFMVLLQNEPDRIRSAPKQTMLFSSQWTRGIESFFRSYLQDPITIITSKFEAAVYGRVKQKVHMCRSQQLNNKLLGLVDMLHGRAILVFTGTVQEAKTVYNLLNGHGSFYVLLAHDDMTSLQLSELREEWCSDHRTDSKPVLVMTDYCISELQIRNAQCVVHYNIPDKFKFGQRLSCMAEHYKEMGDERRDSPEVVCQSHILVTEKCSSQAPHLVTLLQRLREPVPRDLQAMVSGILEGKEEGKCGDLCVAMKAFGKCINQSKCEHRHVISSTYDDPENQRGIILPQVGEVKVLITHVQDASCYFVRLLEHRDLLGGIHPTNTEFMKLSFDMRLWYANPANKVQYAFTSPPVVHDLCTHEGRDGIYHRVKITKVLDERRLTQEKVEVLFVDTGRIEVVEICRLFTLPNEFSGIPYQAVLVFICRVKPMDHDTDWTSKANQFVLNLICGKDMDGKIVLSIGNTLWLDPLVERARLKHVRMVTNQCNVRRELLRNGLAVDNPQHIELLRAACEGKIKLPEVIEAEIEEGVEDSRVHGSEARQYDFCILPENDDYHTVYVSAVDTPELFFLQRSESSNEVDTMLDEINAGELDVDGKVEPVVGELCLAKFSVDDRWYRAQILSQKEDKVEVFFVDFGDRESLSETDLCPLPEVYRNFPFQAMECSLANITASEGKWSEDDCDALWDLTHTDDGIKKPLNAKVVKKICSVFVGIQKYVVELFDTTTEIDIHVNQELVKLGHARTVPVYEEDYFPEAIEVQKNYDYLYQKIPDLCAFLSRTQSVTKKLAVSKSIYSIVVKSTNFKDEMRVYSCLQSLCMLLGEVESLQVLDHLVTALISIAMNNTRNCDEILKLGGVKFICEHLKATDDPHMQKCFSWALKHLALNERMRTAIREESGVDILCSLLKSSKDGDVIDSVVWSLVYLVTECFRNCQVLKDVNCVECLVEIIKTSEKETTVEGATSIVSAMASHLQFRDFLRKERVIQALGERLSRTNSEKVVHVATKAFKNLANNNRPNKETMLSYGLIEIMTDLLGKEVVNSEVVRRLTLDIINKLKAARINLSACPMSPSRLAASENLYEYEEFSPRAVNGNAKKQKEKITAIPIPTDMPPLRPEEGADIKWVNPKVMWSQNLHRCLISIKLCGVKEPDVCVKHASIHFSSVLGSLFYKLDLDLFANVDEEKSCYSTLGSEILLSLKKEKKERWPRLLKDKQKLPFILVDHERYVDSSSETDSSDDDTPFVLARRARNVLPKGTGQSKYVGGRPNWSSDSSGEDSTDDDSSFEPLGNREMDSKDPYDIFS